MKTINRTMLTLNGKHALHKATSKDEWRPALQSIHYEASDRALVATNGSILARVLVDTDDAADNPPARIPNDAYRAALKGPARAVKFLTLERPEDGGPVVGAGNATYPAGDDGQAFPDWRGVWPSWANDAACDKRKPLLCIDVELLADLTAAIREDGRAGQIELYAELDDDGRPVPNVALYVRPIGPGGGDSGRGIIMPVRCP